RLLEPTVEEAMTMSTHPTEKVLAAPEELGLDSRTAFRRAAGELLAQLEEGTGRLVIDLSATRQVDSAGLGALMLIQRKAGERRPRAARSIPPRSPGARPPPPGHRWRDSAPGDPRLPSRPPGDRDDLLREHGAADQRARPRALGVSRQAVRYGRPGRAYRCS